MNSSRENETYVININGGPEINLISIILTILTILICLFVYTLIIKSSKPNKYSMNVILSCNTYLCIMTYALCIFTQYLRTLFSDYGRKTSDSIEFGTIKMSRTADFMCRLGAYLTYSLLMNVLLSTNVQALYRMLKIMSLPGHEYRILNSQRGYLSVIFIQWILGFVIQSPNIIDSRQYWYEMTTDTCIAAFSNLKASMYSFATIYALPSILIISEYCYLIHHLRRRRNRISLISSFNNNNIHSKQRNMLVIKRIILCVGVLASIGILPIFLMLYFALTGVVIELRYRLQWFGIQISVSIFSIILLFVSPQLASFLPARQGLRKQNQNETQMQTITIGTNRIVR